MADVWIQVGHHNSLQWDAAELLIKVRRCFQYAADRGSAVSKHGGAVASAGLSVVLRMH